jgi:hypothetical protein
MDVVPALHIHVFLTPFAALPEKAEYLGGQLQGVAMHHLAQRGHDLLRCRRITSQRRARMHDGHHGLSLFPGRAAADLCQRVTSKLRIGKLCTACSISATARSVCMVFLLGIITEPGSLCAATWQPGVHSGR